MPQYSPSEIYISITNSWRIKLPAYTFPSSGSYDSKRDIRYWMNLQCDDYESKQMLRAGTFTGSIADITLPAPNDLNAQADINYTEEERQGGMIDPSVSGLGWLFGGGFIIDKIRAAFDVLLGRRDMDERDTTFKDAGFRKFDYNWTLVPKNKEDADQVNKIAQSFQVLAYPSLSTFSGGAKIIHPPIWNIQILDTAAGESGLYKWDMGPNICVLTKASIKTANNGVYSTKDSYPAATTISLSFQELEPAVRIDDTKLVSRSQARNFGGRDNDL